MSALAERVANAITADRLIAIVRAASADEAVLAAEALAAVGVR
jgi:2-keto-3-deoxy-6-phosphogluconate aldolase